MDSVKVLFVDDEAIVREVFLEKMHSARWRETLSCKLPIDCETRTGIDDVSDEELQWCDILVVDYRLAETVTGLGYVEGLDFSRQLCLVISQTSEAVAEFYQHPLVHQHAGRVLMVPKTDPGRWFDDVLLPCICSYCKTIESLKLNEENAKEKAYLERQFLGVWRGRSATGPSKFGTLMGSSDVMKEVFALAARAAELPSPLLITGATGTGKTHLAMAIHQHSPVRQNSPFVSIACANLPENMLEAELFGVIANYPGFHNLAALPGKLETADGGTVLLDEIGRMPLSCQAKLLSVFDSYEPPSTYAVARLGERTARCIDLRFISATDVELEVAVAKGQFLAPLYRRIKVLEIELPPLRDRREDIPVLLSTFMARASQITGERPVQLTDGALNALQRHDWKQNVGELANWTERLVGLYPGVVVDEEHEMIRRLAATDANRLTTDPAQIWRRLLEREISLDLKQITRRFGEPAAIEIARLAIVHFGGCFPPDPDCGGLFGGMNRASFKMWLYRRGFSLADLKEG